MSVVNSDNLTKVTPRTGQPVVEINGAKYPLAFKIVGEPATFTENTELGVVEVGKGVVSEDFEFQLTKTTLGRDGLNVHAGPGYISGTATLTLPEAEITTDTSGTVITSGFVTETVEIPAVAVDGPVQQIDFGVVDSTGKFQPLDLSGDTPVAIGDSEDVDYTVFATDRPHPEPDTGGGSSGGDGISQLVKVSEFVAPYDAYSAVESIIVSGFGEADTWGDMIDYSSWNGTYVVTPDTVSANSTEKRIYKHPTENKYLYRMFCNDSMGYYWVFHTNTSVDYFYDADFYADELGSGAWSSYQYEISFDLTITQNNVNYPKQELVLKVQPATGSSISNDLRTWEFGDAVNLTKYETTPVEGAMHVVLGGDLLSNKVYPTTTQGVNGLLFYAPLTSADNDLVVGSYTASKPFEYSEYGAELESLYLLTDVPVSALQGDFTFFAEVTVHETASYYHPLFAAYDSDYMVGLNTITNAYSMWAGSSEGNWNILTGDSSYSSDETSSSGRGSIAATQDVTQKIAMTRNGDIWELYVDNVLSLRRNRPGTIRATGYIALHKWAGDGSMTNAPTAMKNVKIYSRGMTAEEIAQL